MKNLSSYEAREIAYHLMDGGWTSRDKDSFIEENAKQDAENILSEEDIDTVFGEIASIELETLQSMVEDFIAGGSPEYDNLLPDYKSSRYDDELDCWCVDAEDDKCTYLLTAGSDGNIQIHYSGTK